MSDTPRKGKSWLTDKLAEGADRLWHEPQTQRFSFRNDSPHLVQPAGAPTQPGHARSSAGARADESADAHRGLNENLLLSVMSIRVNARDRKQKGKAVQTWLRCSFIKRVIEMPRPHRIGNCARYGVLLAFLQYHKLVTRNGPGYVWADAYKHLPARAGWLVDLARREGELRRLDSPVRFEIFG